MFCEVTAEFENEDGERFLVLPTIDFEDLPIGTPVALTAFQMETDAEPVLQVILYAEIETLKY